MPHDPYVTLTVDPADLRPGDTVVAISDHDAAGCHCDVTVTIRRLPDSVVA